MVWPTSVLAFCIALVSASTTSPAVCAPPTIVSTDQSPSLLPNIILGDYGSVEPDLPAPVRRRKSPAVRLDQRGIGSSQLSPWSTAVANGRTLWASLQKVLNDRTAVDTSTCDIDTRWQMWVNLDRPGYLDFSWETVNPPADLAQQKLAWYRASIKFPRGLRPSYYTHVSRYSIEYKAILAELTFGKGSSHPEAPATVPDHWSEVTWNYWTAICAAKNTDPSELYYVLREKISNDDTRAIMDDIFSALPASAIPPLGQPVIITVTPADESFYALLKTPNVVGVVYMLMQHKNALRRKTIKSIFVAKRTLKFDKEFGMYYLVVELDDFFEDATSSRSSSNSGSAWASSADEEHGTVGVGE